MRTRRWKASIALVVASIAALGFPAAASAGVKCKGASTFGSGLLENQAVNSWVSKVRASYGAAWANWSLARNKQWSQIALPASTLYSVTAVPCRKT